MQGFQEMMTTVMGRERMLKSDVLNGSGASSFEVGQHQLNCSS